MPAVSTQLNDFILPATRPATPVTAGLASRISAFFRDVHHRRQDGDIARLIESKGGRLTDDIERQIERRFV